MITIGDSTDYNVSLIDENNAFGIYLKSTTIAERGQIIPPLGGHQTFGADTTLFINQGASKVLFQLRNMIFAATAENLLMLRKAITYWNKNNLLVKYVELDKDGNDRGKWPIYSSIAATAYNAADFSQIYVKLLAYSRNTEDGMNDSFDFLLERVTTSENEEES